MTDVSSKRKSRELLVKDKVTGYPRMMQNLQGGW